MKGKRVNNTEFFSQCILGEGCYSKNALLLQLKKLEPLFVINLQKRSILHSTNVKKF